jgi:ankyrin repeat protein
MEKNLEEINLFKLIENKKYDKLIDYIKTKSELDLNLSDNFGNYFIEYVINTYDIDLIKEIFKKEIYLDIIDSNGTTLLYNLIKFNKMEILKLVIEKQNSSIGISLIDKKDIRGRTALHYCVIFNNPEIFEYLLDNEGDPFATNNSGENLFFYSLKYNKNQLLIDLLKKFNAVNIKNSEGENLLQTAISLKNTAIIEYLLENTNIDFNSKTKEYGITALHQLVVLNNLKYLQKIVDLGADITVTDFLGNNVIHFAMIENNFKIAKYFIKMGKINLNNTNLNGDTPLHIYLENINNDYDSDLLSIMIKESNLNIQNHQGMSSLHFLASKQLLDKFSYLLEEKMLNIFIQNYKGETVYSMIKDKDKVLDVVVISFLNNLKEGDFLIDWEKECHNIVTGNQKKENKMKSKSDCIKKIKDTIINENRSIPKFKEINFDFNSGIVLKDCYFSGFPIDTLFGLLWLKKKIPTVSLILGYPLSENNEVYDFYSNMGKDFNYKLDFINCMILWSYQKIFIPSFFDTIINKEIKEESNVIIIPIGIETAQGAHTNILFWDLKNKILERFEPNGKNQPLNFDYNPKLLDKYIETYFKKFNIPFTYLTPKDYLPIIGFIMIENLENDRCSKIGDPNGFCTAWCIWYCYQKLLNFTDSADNIISSEKLVLLLINNLKLEAKSFKNLIRDFSKNISEYRDTFLNKVKLDINDWILTNYDAEKLNELEKIILKLT